MKGLLGIAALALASVAQAAPFAVQLGDARIGLDAPPGFADTISTGSPRLLELAEALTSPSNRILLFAISDGDLRRFTVGDPIEARRYMIAVTPRASEHERMNEGAFRSFTANSLQGLGQPPAEKDYLKYLESRPVGALSLLAELRKDADVVSVLQGMHALAKEGRSERSQYLLSTNTLMLLRGKAISLTVHAKYDDAADLEWIRITTARWIEDLKRLNSR